MAGAAPAPVVQRDVLRRGFAILGLAVREQPAVFAVSVAGGAVYAATTVGSAFVFGAVTSRVVLPAFRDGRTTAGALALSVVVILAVAVLKAVGVVARRLGAGIMQYRLQASYRRQVTRQYLRLPMGWHQRHSTGELLSNANSDVEAVWYPIAPFPFAVGVLVMLVLSAVALVFTDPVLALVGFLVFPAVAVINVVYNRRLSPLASRAQQLRGEVSGIAHESFDGALVVKTLGREAAETARFEARSQQLRDSLIAMGRVRGLFDPALEALPSLGVLAVLLVGTTRVESGALGPGELVRVAYLFTVLAFPLRAIGWVLSEMPRSVAGYARVRRVLDASGELPSGEAALVPSGHPAALRVESASFAYEGLPPVLHGVTVDVPPGRTVALVGPTGSGKSTIASLLVRLVDPATGTVTLDGVDMRDLPAGGVSEHVALVPQEAFLFDDTVRENVILGGGFGDEEVWAALRLAQADRFVAALPAALDTRVGERGTTLSGGQRQRLALARALVRRPRLLVLDDATSSVDATVEAAILAGLRSGDVAGTVVVVAYRQATISLADEVVYVENGVVLDRGTSDELLEREPGYRRMVTAYAEAEADRRRDKASARTPVGAATGVDR